MKHMESEKLTKIQKLFKWVEDSSQGPSGTDRGSFGFLGGFSPQIGTISSGSGISAGVLFQRSLFQASATFSTAGYKEYDAQIGINRPKEKVFIDVHRPTDPFHFAAIQEKGFFGYVDIRYRDLTQEDFYGVGLNSKLENRTDYGLKGASYTGIAGYQFGHWLRLDLRYGLLQPEIYSGTDSRFPNSEEIFTEAEAPGLTGQPDFAHVGTTAIFNYSDNRKNPKKGGQLGVTFIRFDDKNENVYQFNRFQIDARHYLPLWSDSRVLAVRFLNSISDPDEDAQVPFYLMETLGDSRTLRGYEQLRFRDENVIHFTVEYRWEPSVFLELAAFVDSGKVYNQITNFDFDDFKTTYGLGARIKTDKVVFLRIDYGRSDEGSAVYLKFGRSF